MDMRSLIRFPTSRTRPEPATRSPSADSLSPWSSANDAGFSVVRGMSPSDYKAAGESIRRTGYELNAIVNACIRVTADQIGVARLEAYGIEAGGTILLYPDDPLQELLDQPAPQLSGFTFRRTMALHLVMYGNAYALLVRDGRGKVDRIRMIHPERVQQVTVDGTTDEIVQYIWNDGTGRQHITPWTDILHVKDHLVDPDGWFGFPRGLSTLAQIATDSDASQYVRQVLNNSGVPSLVLFGRQGAGVDDLKRAEEAWHERMAVQGGRGRTRFLGGIESLQVIGHSLKDLEFPSLRQISREDICAAFGVDPRLIGAGSAKGGEGGLSGSQYQEARRRLEQQTCHPMRIAIQDALDTTLTPEFGFRYARFSADAIAAIVETPTEVAQRSAVLVASNIMTLDEARRTNGLPEAQNPEHITAAKQLSTIEDALTVGESASDVAEMASAAEELAAEDAADTEDTAGSAPATTSGVAKGASPSEQVNGPDGITDTNTSRASIAPQSRQSIPSRQRVSGAPDLTPDEETLAWMAFNDKALALEPFIASAAQDAIDEIVANVLRTLDVSQNSDTIRAVNDPWWDRFLSGLGTLFGGGGVIRSMWVRMFSRRMTDVAEKIAESFAQETGKRFNSDDPAFAAGVRKRWETLAESATKTIANRLNEAVRLGRAANLSSAEIAALVRNMDFGAMIRRIAQTESVGLINHAEMMAAEQMGSFRKKKWLSQRDNRVRSSHVTCDSRGWIDMALAFPNGLRYAHDPAGGADEVDNCRCATIYSDREVSL